VEKKCIENEIDPQTHKLLDTTSTKSTRSDEMNQNAQRVVDSYKCNAFVKLKNRSY